MLINNENFDSLGITIGMLVYIRTVGTKNVGDVVKYMGREEDGIFIYISGKFSRIKIFWDVIVDLCPHIN